MRAISLLCRPTRRESLDKLSARRARTASSSSPSSPVAAPILFMELPRLILHPGMPREGSCPVSAVIVSLLSLPPAREKALLSPSYVESLLWRSRGRRLSWQVVPRCHGVMMPTRRRVAIRSHSRYLPLSVIHAPSSARHLQHPRRRLPVLKILGERRLSSCRALSCRP